MNIRKNIKLCATSLLLLLCVACSNDKDSNVDNSSASLPIPGMNVENFPIIDGSDSTEPLRDILMCNLLDYKYTWERYGLLQYDWQNKQTVFPVYTCSDQRRELLKKKMLRSNTHASFENLINGSVNLVIAARAASRDENKYAEERKVTLIEKPIAKDALTFMVNNENPVNSLSVEQIRKIYTGEITNWKEVGGDDLTIQPFVRNRNSGSQEKFETMVMDGLEMANLPEWSIGAGMDTPYAQIENTKAGLAFTPFYYYSVIIGNGQTKALSIGNVIMAKSSIKEDSYPFITNVYASIRSDIDKNSTAYKVFEFLTTQRGQDIVEASGYVRIK